MGLGMIAQVLSALFVLVSGLWAIPQVHDAVPALSWAIVVLGIVGGLAWLVTAFSAKK